LAQSVRRAASSSGRWWKSGNIGRIDEELLYLIDRKKDASSAAGSTYASGRSGAERTPAIPVSAVVDQHQAGEAVHAGVVLRDNCVQPNPHAGRTSKR
jgi:acyl-CoA synthetase (AMP-forming)/AMP-acid ligase II